METSILNSIKKILGISENYTAFDIDIIMHINSVFSILTQMGIGPEEGFSIEDALTEWSQFITNNNNYNLIKSYMCLKVRMLFDPPANSFLIAPMEKQIQEYEWRLSTFREWFLNPVDPLLEEAEVTYEY
jgi:hypothetical protein